MRGGHAVVASYNSNGSSERPTEQIERTKEKVAAIRAGRGVGTAASYTIAAALFNSGNLCRPEGCEPVTKLNPACYYSLTDCFATAQGIIMQKTLQLIWAMPDGT